MNSKQRNLFFIIACLFGWFFISENVYAVESIELPCPRQISSTECGHDSCPRKLTSQYNGETIDWNYYTCVRDACRTKGIYVLYSHSNGGCVIKGQGQPVHSCFFVRQDDHRPRTEIGILGYSHVGPEYC